MIKRLVVCPADCNAENIRTLIWGGAPMYVEDALAALDRFGPRLAQIYGQGEAPMTITTLSKQDIADRDHPRWRERLASAGKPYACVEVMVADAQDRPLARGRGGRNSLPRRASWRAIGTIREAIRGLAARRLAAHRRRRRLRRRGLSAPQGPLQGPDHLRRLQHLSARSRGSAAHPCRRCARSRSSAGPTGNGARRWWPMWSARRSAAELDALCLAAYCALQAAEGLCFCRRAAEKQLRQDPEDGTARDGCGEGRTRNERDRPQTSAARCPLCGKATEQAFKPFCSKRCADIDLNRWLSGVYAVPVKEDEDEDGERPADGEPGEKS